MEQWPLVKLEIAYLQDRLFHLPNRMLQSRLFTNEEFMKIYTICYDMAIHRDHNHSGFLYEEFNNIIKDFCDRCSYELNKYDLDSMMFQWIKIYDRFILFQNWMCRFLMYLNRGYIKNNNYLSLEESSCKIFQETVFHESAYPLYYAYNRFIRKDRCDIKRMVLEEDIFFIKRCLNAMLTTDKTSYLFLQMEYLRELGSFLEEYTATHARELIPCEYMRRVDQEIQAEEKRVQIFMKEETLAPARSLMHRKLLQDYFSEIFSTVHNAFLESLKNRDSFMTSLFFRLFHTAGMEEAMVRMSQDFTKYALTQLEASLDEDIERFLEAHEEMVVMMRRDLGDHVLFQQAYLQILRQIVNKNPSRLTQYLDRVMRIGNVSESRIHVICELLSYHSESDVIAETLRRDMAKRLFMNRTHSQEWEKTLLSSLKLRFGYQFTTRMEGMRFDYTTQLLTTEYIPSPEGTVRLLTGSHWPSFSAPDDIVTLPPLMTRCMAHFDAFFKEYYSTRRITWQHHLSNFHLQGIYNAGKTRRYDIFCGFLQGIVLLWMADRASPEKEISLQEISKGTRFSFSLLFPILHSLVFASNKLLLKSPMTDHKIRETDMFSLNCDFSSKRSTLQLPTIMVDPPKVQEKIQEDRKFYLEAIIVRIMKARKKMSHRDLVQEVMRQSTITMESKMIKTMIEKLMEKEYLERAEEDTSVYLYVA